MIQYRLSQKFPHDSFLQVEILIKPTKADFEVKLPDWRPGRYQLGNFSKYLRNFNAFDKNEEPLNFKKTNRNTWLIHCEDEECIIRYEIYTSIIDGGSTFVDEEHWYLNFINCMIYQADDMKQVHKVHLDIPNDWEIACGLKKEGKELVADSFYELVDSPALVSNKLQHLEYRVQETNFHLWFRGNADLKNKNQILDDFKKFTAYQIETMGEFESKDYHFLFQIPDEKAYHGVEHLNSTCIVLGPAKEFNSETFYNNFLGISSHELFHYWNIIRIRPEEMYPYNFDKENYFITGYVAEGVTTYYGDLFLVRSGVKDLDWYIDELNILFKRHFENYGRFNTSVAESSWDLWLDGYEAGIPHRKVSIYVKGALIALILDLKIILESNGEKSLDDVMRKLWTDFYKKDKGYSSEDYLKTAEEVIGYELTDYLNKFITGCEPVENELKILLDQFGFEMELKANENSITHHLGLKINEETVISIAPDSPAEKAFRIGDKLIGINKQKFEEIQDVIHFEEETSYSFQFFRNNNLREVTIKTENGGFYSRYILKGNNDIKEDEKIMRKKWLNV
ncbi:peptidase M61 [Marivirga tractuosa]|uniref:Peptidase M61 domain protein n=1 Tax=Marivirga tractuosa (strain ATCC 23168 / DSM 4126 / NBRC 15989 / NCIMB 1408 / VKM B-1430 / H-43) TaxID=643867 RepID=E4TQW7_MARTH|nr:M61 family metallopeptidase [Marivirga tractuosa]ADR21667.1 peptidase M61 domain protein [Marivirga tractuosa DSM 4126]BDD13876.1 peptidase M61 [Marivirga tractuosa]